MDINLRKIICGIKGVYLPVSGGLGLDFESRIIVHENFYDFALHTIKEVLSILIDIFMLDVRSNKFVETVEIQDCEIYRIKLSHVYEDNDGEEQTLNIEIYFDISKSFGNIGYALKEVKTKEEIDTLIEQTDSRTASTQSIPHFKDAVTATLTYGGTLKSESDWIEVFDVSEVEAHRITDLLNKCGLDDRALQTYYTNYIGHIYPKHFWEEYWNYF